MQLFGKKNKDEKPKLGVLVTVMSADPAFVVLEDFQITVKVAILMILKKLNLPIEANDGIKMKYFLYRSSGRTDDGFEILAEIDAQGNACVLSEYGIFDKAELYLGAIMLPKKEAREEAREEVKNEKDRADDENPIDDDFKFESEDEDSSDNREEYFEI